MRFNPHLGTSSLQKFARGLMHNISMRPRVVLKYNIKQKSSRSHNLSLRRTRLTDALRWEERLCDLKPIAARRLGQIDSEPDNKENTPAFIPCVSIPSGSITGLLAAGNSGVAKLSLRNKFATPWRDNVRITIV